MGLRIFLFCVFCAFSINSFAQGFNPYKAYGEPTPRKNTLRTILNKVTFTLASGTGYSFYNQTLNNYLIVNSNDRLYINPNGTSDYYYNWLNKPVRSTAPASDDAINTDTVGLTFKGTGSSIPLLFSLHYQYDRFRIGAGASIEFHHFEKMEPNNYSIIGSYKEPFSSIFTRFFATAGVEFYRYYDYHYYVDFYVGSMNYGSAFDKTLLQKGIYFNVGVPIERQFSEYFKVYVRPSYEFKKFNMGLPESTLSIPNNFKALYINLGIRYNIPDLRRCPINSCETQKIHTHQGMGDVRGRPFYKKQRPQIGENFKHSPLFKKGNDKDAPKSNVRKRDPRK